jgi:hypothetical protein
MPYFDATRWLFVGTVRKFPTTQTVVRRQKPEFVPCVLQCLDFRRKKFDHFAAFGANQWS